MRMLELFYDLRDNLDLSNLTSQEQVAYVFFIHIKYLVKPQQYYHKGTTCLTFSLLVMLGALHITRFKLFI